MLEEVTAAFKNEWLEIKGTALVIWHWGKRKSWLKDFRNMFRLKYLIKWIGLAVTITLVVLMFVYKMQIMMWLTIHIMTVQAKPGSWIAPIPFLVITSIPPLFGQELLLLLSGIFFGFSTGVGIGITGTLIGEIVCFQVLYGYMARRGQRTVEKSMNYDCVARMLKDAGLGIITVTRYSPISTHTLTELQCFVGMSFPVFFSHLIFALPKVVLSVYFGSLIGDLTSVRSLQQAAQIQHTLSVIGGLISIPINITMYIVFSRARHYYSEALLDREPQSVFEVPLTSTSTTSLPLSSAINLELDLEAQEDGDEGSSFLKSILGRSTGRASVETVDGWRPLEYKIKSGASSFTRLPLRNEEEMTEVKR